MKDRRSASRYARTVAIVAGALLGLVQLAYATTSTTGIVLGENSNITMTKGKPIVGGTTVTANNLSFFTGSIVASATTGVGIDLPSADNVAKICATAGSSIVVGSGSTCGARTTDDTSPLLATLSAATVEAGTFATYLSGLKPTQTLGDVSVPASGKYTINVGPNQNIIQIGTLTTGKSATINIKATIGLRPAVVVINVTGAVNLGDGTAIRLLGPTAPNRLIWNIESTNPSLGNASVFSGTLLNVPTTASNCTAGALTIDGAIMCSGAITLGTLSLEVGPFLQPVKGTSMGLNAARFGLLNALSQSVALASCLPSSSLSVLIQGSNVTSYVPKGAWSAAGTGISVVPVEGAGSSAVITTPNVVNSCSSNSVTGQTVCTANNTDVYLLSGSTLSNTLTSSGSGSLSFSGGSCTNCGVVVNAAADTATIGLSLATGGGYQFLNLATNSFQTPIATGTGSTGISEDIAIDPVRNFILSPTEAGEYEIVKTTPAISLYENTANAGAVFDSAAEDCSTGVALSSDEFTGNIFIADLTQATFTSGTPAGTWSAPSQLQSLPEFINLSAGTSGLAVAPGTHLAVVTGEFGASDFGGLQLPATSGTGTPAVVDYVAANVPNDPSGNPWQMGLDPHTVTAYVSPANGKGYALIANTPSPTYLAVVDIQALLAAPRSGAHTVDPTVDLVATGVVRFVAVP